MGRLAHYDAEGFIARLTMKKGAVLPDNVSSDQNTCLPPKPFVQNGNTPLWLYFLLGGGGTGLKFHYLVYKGWSIWYSAIIYFLGMLYLRWQLFFIRSR